MLIKSVPVDTSSTRSRRSGANTLATPSATSSTSRSSSTYWSRSENPLTHQITLSGKQFLMHFVRITKSHFKPFICILQIQIETGEATDYSEFTSKLSKMYVANRDQNRCGNVSLNSLLRNFEKLLRPHFLSCFCVTTAKILFNITSFSLPSRLLSVFVKCRKSWKPRSASITHFLRGNLFFSNKTFTPIEKKDHLTAKKLLNSVKRTFLS